jgi:hypothetical protein
MVNTLQHRQTTQCFGLPPASPGNHHPNRPKAGHALTFKLDQSVGGERSGLGLSIVRALLRHHDGFIVLLPSKSGSHFQIDIPLAS